jgi:hypothetical protein
MPNVCQHERHHPSTFAKWQLGRIIIPPMLEAMFPHPIFRASALQLKTGMQQKPQFAKLIEVMVQANILKTLVRPSGSRPGIYSLHELVRLCESRPRK